MKNLSFSFSLLIYVSAIFECKNAYTRVEYSATTAMSCVQCHVTPWGGGPRNLYRKAYGSRDLGVAQTSATEMFYGDFRALAYTSAHAGNRVHGVTLMEAATSANLLILEDENGPHLRGVGTFDFSPMANGPREVYLRWHPSTRDESALNFITVGRLTTPFGLLTDEHRTYVRQQTNMTLNNFVFGAAFSGTPLDGWSYDLQFVNNFQGKMSLTSGEVVWGEILNLRYSPQELPFILGFSQNIQNSKGARPYAFSFYGAFSVTRLTDSKVPVTILGEIVLAKNWNAEAFNPAIGSYFMSNETTVPNYQTAAAASKSLGFFTQVKYDINSRLTLLYKYDYLLMNVQYAGDAFQRHGIGAEYHLNSNIILQLRAEKAIVGRPELKSSNAAAAQDAIFSVFQLWL